MYAYRASERELDMDGWVGEAESEWLECGRAAPVLCGDGVRYVRMYLLVGK